MDINKIAEKSSTSFLDLNSRLIFVRAVNLYFLIKIILSWKASVMIEQVITLPQIRWLPLRFLLLPERIFEHQPEVFLILGIMLCGISLWRPNYLSAILLTWYSVNYFHVHYALINGSDVVLVVCIFLSIGLSIYPVWKKYTGFQMLLFNGASLLIKIQIVIIYLLSGIDKIYSPAWRSGEAIHYMISLDYLFNPNLVGIFPSVPWLNAILSWLVILFELLFPVLIWMSRFRGWILLIGILFHLAIIVLLSLADFGFMMIITYLIYLTDTDLDRFGYGKFRSATPIPS